MKSARFNRLLATTALGLALVLGSHAGMAQQSQQQIDSAVPMPDTDPLPPLTAQDVTGAPAAAPKAEIKQDAAEPAKAAAAPAATPVSATADSAVADQLRDMISGKLDHIVSRKADREGVEQFYKARDYKPLWVSDGAAGRARQGRDRLSRPGRHRWAQPRRLSDAGLQGGDDRQRARRG